MGFSAFLLFGVGLLQLETETVSGGGGGKGQTRQCQVTNAFNLAMIFPQRSSWRQGLWNHRSG
jgi:hypothetical protein